ncbi:MAG TPA: methyltransferase domain-containing protein [Acidimicrobiales bacterium]
MATSSPGAHDTSGMAPEAGPPPNHHAHFPHFAGIGGLLAALTFTVGRGEDADLAAELTGLGPGDDVVDIGCGPGVAARRAAARGAASVVGVDPAAVMLRVARLRRRSGVRYVEGAAEALPLPDDSATVAWSLATVHHWDDVDRGLAEVRRVLRPGGRFLVLERQVRPGATGHASHGWTPEQAETFAERAEAAGLGAATVGRHGTRGGRRPVLSVLARVD